MNPRQPSTRVRRHIQQLKLRLIDLTRRNRLLYFKPSKSSTLTVSRPNAQTVFEHLIVREKGWTFWLPPEEEPEATLFKGEEPRSPRYSNPENARQNQLVCLGRSREELERILKNLYRRATADYQERGVRILYVVFGMLVWREVETSEEVRSPLILVPIELSRESARDPFYLYLAEEAEVVLNPALQVKLRNDFRIELPPVPEDWEEQSLSAYFDLVANAGGRLKWVVNPQVQIGLLSFHKLVMFQDLNANENLIAKHPIVCGLSGEPLTDDLVLDDLPNERQLDAIQQAERAFQILDADSSQQVCIQYALRGQSFVIQGPPGTGKSQTIANIVAESIAAGKTVLFVSEKMAALEVVYKRLRAAGLGDFCLELHSHKAKKRQVVAELKSCLEERPVPQRSLSALEFEKLRQLKEKLNNYVIALHQVRSPLERSVYDALSLLAKLDAVPLVSMELPEPTNLTPTQLQELEEMTRRLGTVWPVIQEGEDFPWRGFSGNQFTLDLRSELISLLGQLMSSIDRLSLASAQYASEIGLDIPSSLEEVEWLIKVSELLADSPGPDSEWLTHPNLDGLVAEAQHYQELCSSCRTMRAVLMECYSPAFFNLPRGLAAELESARTQTSHLLAPGGSGGALLLKQRNKLREFIMTTKRAVAEWLRDADAIARPVGLASNDPTMDRARQLAQLALLCHSESRPDASWLDPIRAQHLRDILPRVRVDYEKYNEAKRRLLNFYDESFLELELDRLIERYHGSYRTIFRWFIPTFYRDKRTIARTTRTGMVPESILEDLLTARELRRLAAQLATERDHVRNLLGGYYRGYDTDFDLVERALSIATEAIALARVTPVPNELVRTISLGTISPPEIRVVGTQLRDSLEDWKQAAQAFSSLLFGPTEPFRIVECPNCGTSNRLDYPPKESGTYRCGSCKAAIDPKRVGSSDRLPGSDRPFSQTPLSEIERWAREIGTPLDSLCRLTEQVLNTCIGEPPIDYRAIVADLGRLDKLVEVESGIAAESERLRSQFGTRYHSIDTDWANVLAALDWTGQVQKLFGSRAIPSRFSQISSQGAMAAPSNDELTQAYLATKALLESLQARFDLPRQSQERPGFLQTAEEKLKARSERPALTHRRVPLRELTLERLRERLRELRSRVDDLQTWIDFKALERRFTEAGLKGFIKRLQATPPPASQLIDVFHKAVYQAWASSIFDEDPHIGDFRTRHHEQLIEEFREIDRKLVRLSGHRVIEQCNSRRPQSVVLVGDSEVSTLMREAHKQRRHLPIRQLFERIPNLLFRLKPCLMMSPISVSQFLNPERLHFDLVIFDEASQICPEDAVGSVYRGDQLIVAGDNKQLPPTAFFQQAMAEEYDWEDISDEEFAVFDSILDECSSIGLPARMLRWHYRSKHESLIAFSNKQFYDNHLITFPSAWAKHEHLGIKFVYVPDGVYDRGGKRDNSREAEVVTDLVFEHFARHPEKTLGVVAFSIAQMTAMEDEVERRRRSQPEFERFFKDDRLEGFFVKNLENVQGDERDVMIFSVGYGKDQQGRMTMNFGPLNKPGGERRLNVAVTRAREKVTLVSSIKAADMDLSATQAPGVFQLHRYLDYAEKGEVALELTHPQGGEPQSGLESDVAGEIVRLGYRVVHQVGCSGYRIDLGVVDPAEPGRFLLAVECDGATYHSAYTARDRDRLRQQVLESFGWWIHRIWSPDWAVRRKAEVERLKSAIEKARRSGPRSPSLSGSNPSTNSINNPSSKTQRAPIILSDIGKIPGTVPYKVAELRPRGRIGRDFHSPEWRPERCRLLAKLVREEGPVHIDYATKRIVSAWGLERTGSRIVDAIREAVSLCQKEGSLRRRGKFLWPPDLTEVSVRVPDPNIPESLREIEHIPPEEIQGAIFLIVRHTVGIIYESLLVETARLFGFDRTGSNIRSKLIKVLEKMESDGIVLRNGDSIMLGLSQL